MLRFLAVLLVIGGLCADRAIGQTREEKVRADKKKFEAEGYWIYNDLPKAFDQAKTSGKPIIVVLRCIPCEECVKLDDEIMDADPQLHKLLDQFVRIRQVSTNGLDLSLFQFDTDQSFAIFLLNADGTIYGRFGTRSHRTEWTGDVSVEGLTKALQGALDLHKNYPNNQAQLAGKRGPKPVIARPELYPSLKAKYKESLDYAGKVVPSCIHCHQVGEARRENILRETGTLPEKDLFPFPNPKTAGFVLDPTEKAVIDAVTPNGPAAASGFQPGDRIQSLAGQPLLSIADVQWVLHNADPKGADVPAVVVRPDKPQPKTLDLTLKLPAGWRQADDISWRAGTWGLRRVALGGFFGVPLPDDLRTKWKIPAGQTALFIQHVGLYPPHNVADKAGVKKGDILIACDGRRDFLRETDLLSYILWNKKPGQTLNLTLLRDGKPLDVAFPLPKP